MYLVTVALSTSVSSLEKQPAGCTEYCAVDVQVPGERYTWAAISGNKLHS